MASFFLSSSSEKRRFLWPNDEISIFFASCTFATGIFFRTKFYFLASHHRGSEYTQWRVLCWHEEKGLLHLWRPRELKMTSFERREIFFFHVFNLFDSFFREKSCSRRNFAFLPSFFTQKEKERVKKYKIRHRIRREICQLHRAMTNGKSGTFFVCSLICDGSLDDRSRQQPAESAGDRDNRFFLPSATLEQPFHHLYLLDWAPRLLSGIIGFNIFIHQWLCIEKRSQPVNQPNPTTGT